ncbi:MaoC family dehydratase [Agrococcus carbonis]|uniref:Acyl dehydratase n=1 Tax=Agrococcus carbonis TaxID=684552 RepID=A0A1H1PRF2_9MICO|nr:MaoC family dehydratase [Agrococcus carbonis]SDS13911.1 Acyl dehydratase [Agrococcus carbonis]
MHTITSLGDAERLVGSTLGMSDWLELDQARIDAFAEATGDQQWLHTDPQRAAAGPFGTTVAHGFLLLSLLPLLSASAVHITGFASVINYGLEQVRFPAPAPNGSRVRDIVALAAARATKGGVLLTVDHTLEVEGREKPACVARQLRVLL